MTVDDPTHTGSHPGLPSPMPFGEVLGITVLTAEPDRVVCRLEIRDDHLNQGLLAHGGALFTLADTAIGLAANPPGTETPWVGTSFAVSLFRGVGVGDVVRATATLENRSRRLAAYRATLEREPDGRLLGTVGAQLLAAPGIADPPASPIWRDADPDSPLVRALREARRGEGGGPVKDSDSAGDRPTRVLRSGEQPLGLDDNEGSWIHPRWRPVLGDDPPAGSSRS